MGFEEFFDNNRTNYRNIRRDSQLNDDEYSDNSGFPFIGNKDNTLLQNFLEKIRTNKKLKIFVVLAGIVIIIIVIVLIILLLPLIKNLINFIIQNGLQGVIDEIKGFLDKILKGTAN